MSGELARVETRRYQRLEAPPRHIILEDWTIRQPGAPLSKTAITHFHRAAKAYHAASQRALNDLTASPDLSQNAVDDIWSEHCLVIDNLIDFTPHLEECLDTTSSAAFFTLIYGVPKYQKAKLLMRRSHRIVETLNDSVKIQHLRNENEAADQMRRIYAFCNYRRTIFEDRLAQAQRAVTWFNANQPASPEARTEWEEWAWHHSEQWWQAQWVMDEDLKQLRRKVKPALHAHLESDHPDMAPGTSISRQIDMLIDKMRDEAFPSADEEQEEDDDDGPRNISVWTRGKLAELEASLDYTSITINTKTVPSSPDLRLLESQLLDGCCPISMIPFETPCELVRCHHVFSFEYVVLWLDAYDRPKCPKCRGRTSFDDLRLLDVVGMEEGSSTDEEREESSGTDDSNADGDQEVGEESLDDTNLSIAIQIQLEDEGEQEEDCLPADWI